jgi:hypothetical protein
MAKENRKNRTYDYFEIILRTGRNKSLVFGNAPTRARTPNEALSKLLKKISLGKPAINNRIVKRLRLTNRNLKIVKCFNWPSAESRLIRAIFYESADKIKKNN